MLLTTLNLIALKSNDVERLVEFYQKIGLPLEQQQRGAAPAYHAAEIGGVTLEIHSAGSTITKTTNARLGFTTEKMSKVLTAAEQAGAKILSQPTESPWGLRAVVSDPDGNKIEFIENGS